MQRLERQVQSLSEQLKAVQAELRQLKAGQPAPVSSGTASAPVAAQTTAPSTATTPVASGNELPTLPATAAGASSPWDHLSIYGYGEVNYYHPTHRADLTTADLARAVFGFSYAYDDRTHFYSEFEIEHAVASSEDRGEFEVEQFYVDHRLADWAAVKAGVFLIPSGLLNLNHEPVYYYGVQRNFVERLVIPTTWREGGVALHGDFAQGFGYDLGVTTGLNLKSYDFNPAAPLYETAAELNSGDINPFQAGHQEMQLANAQHLAQYLALSYKGVPGLGLGASVFTGNVANAVGLPDQRSTLWETHVRYNPGRLDLSALYARGILSNTAAANRLNPGASNPEPSKFYGWYLQGAYTVWRHNEMRLAPFVRFERYDIGAGYAGLAPGSSAVPASFPQPFDRVWTGGLNFYLTPKVVFKADYQSFSTNSDLTRFDLGLGLVF
ncbi:MAG: porin [Nevskiaceae bacterium]|nr:MAG: porin [Nevskiaceae bacterium]TBR73194.1 MAG: porin [Nevskiaceae bacterium]